MQQSSHEMKARAKESVGAELTPQERRALEQANARKVDPVVMRSSDVLSTKPMSVTPGDDAVLEFIKYVLSLKQKSPGLGEDVNLPMDRVALLGQMRQK